MLAAWVHAASRVVVALVSAFDATAPHVHEDCLDNLVALYGRNMFFLKRGASCCRNHQKHSTLSTHTPQAHATRTHWVFFVMLKNHGDVLRWSCARCWSCASFSCLSGCLLYSDLILGDESERVCSLSRSPEYFALPPLEQLAEPVVQEKPFAFHKDARGFLSVGRLRSDGLQRDKP